MSETAFQIEYNEDLKRLTELLMAVDRPGSFMSDGKLVTPLPRIDVQGLSAPLAFPLLDVQAGELAEVAEVAPYGRGEETRYDENVRRTKQIAPDRVSIGGALWSQTLEKILSHTTKGLGCESLTVRAEFYKLLLYQVGDFFAPHRDTEKVENMFATLVISLPSFFEGGELVLRHHQQEKSVCLAPEDSSEIRFAAFFADCEHEVRPVTAGNRLCLVYNLVYEETDGSSAPTAPDDTSPVAQIAAELSLWKRDQADAAKVAWLLDYAYTPAGLSFQGLKQVDAARANVLRSAAERVQCVVYLGLVHIEESGAAQVDYGYKSRYSGRYSRYFDYDEEDEPEGVDEDFEVIEVSDYDHSITDWVSPEDEPMNFGRLPLCAGELLPAHALDGEPPDEQRVTEATGNEGASFERAYHRAALIFWDQDRTAEMLIAAGASAAVAYLADCVAKANLQNPGEYKQLKSAATQIVRKWRKDRVHHWRQPDRGSGVGQMLETLRLLGDGRLVQQFVKNVVVESFEPGINDALVGCIQLLKPKTQRRLVGQLMGQQGEIFTADCMDLLVQLSKSLPDPDLCAEVAEALIAALPSKSGRVDPACEYLSFGAPIPTPLSGKHLAEFFQTLESLGVEHLTQSAVDKMLNAPKVYPLQGVILSALREMKKGGLRRVGDDSSAYTSFWKAVTSFHLRRSATPPEEPTDWAQPVKQGCRCKDCQALLQFAADPVARSARFPLRKDRRQHLHQRIERDDLDMTHETERKGSPYTLVCTKTRRAHEKRLSQYAQDIESMRFLRQHVPPGGETQREDLKRAIELSSSGQRNKASR